MDNLDNYREIIKKIIYEYGTHKPANGQIDVEIVIDT